MDGINWYHKKIDEDLLTTCVFRTFYYVQDTFKKFWEKLKEYAVKSSKSSNYLKENLPEFTKIKKIMPWPYWEIPNEEREKKHTKKKEKKGSEPDIVIETENCVLIVEAELMKDFEADQLVTQFLASKDRWKEKPIFHLLLNKTLCYPTALDDAIKEKEFQKRLLWFNWQGIVEVFEEWLNERPNDLGSIIVKDTIKSILSVSNGALRPVKPPIKKLENLAKSKSEMGQFVQFLKHLYTLNTLPLLKVQENGENMRKFVDYLKNSKIKEGGQNE